MAGVMPAIIIIMEKIDNSKFYEAMNNYYATGEKKYYDIMFIEVNHVCQGIIRKMSNRCKGIYTLSELNDFAIDATCKVMEKIVATKPVVENITNFCWLWCKAMFTTYPMLKQAQFEKNIQYFDSFSNNLEYENTITDDIILEDVE